mgnify:CR=1 FL=1
MRESISITTIFQIVILFILLFTAIMALTINNSNAFGIKDQVVNILETNQGRYKEGESLDQEIVDLLASTSYRNTGKCSDGFTGFDRNGAMVNSDQQAAICIREVNATEGVDNYLNRVLQGNVATGEFMPGKYYQVEVFFQLDLPVVKQIYNFKSKAETKVIYQGK